MTSKSAGQKPYVELRGLHKSFGTTEVLRSISLDLAEGEILALVGPSGSGKTTLLRLLAGFEKPDRGEINIAGDPVAALAPAKRGVGMVFQHYALFPHMSIEANVAFGLQSRAWPEAEVAPRVREMLQLVDLAGFGSRRVSEVSGGQQQRVALARALAPKPRVLLLDEPLSNLDPSLRERTRRELRQAVREVGITTILVTHEQEEAFHLGDRVAVLHAGRLEQVGSPRQLYDLPATPFVASFVGRAAIVDAEFAGEEQILLPDGEKDPGVVRWQGETVGEVQAGETVRVALRPESLRLVASGGGESLAGELVERRYTGMATYGTVRLCQEGAVASVPSEVEVLMDFDEASEGEAVWLEPRAGGPLPRIFSSSSSPALEPVD